MPKIIPALYRELRRSFELPWNSQCTASAKCISASGKRKGGLAIHTIFVLQREIMTNSICFLQTYKLFYLQSHVTKKNNNKAKNKKYNRSLENISRPGVEPWQYQSDTCLFWFSFFKL